VVANTSLCAQPGNASDEIKLSLTDLPQINMSLDMEANMDIEEEDADDPLQEAGNHSFIISRNPPHQTIRPPFKNHGNLPSPDAQQDLPPTKDDTDGPTEEEKGDDYPTKSHDEIVDPLPEESTGDDEDGDFGSDDLLMEGWWSSWHGAPKHNNSKYAVKVCPQGTFIKTMQMVMSSTHNHSLQRIEATRCSRAALRNFHRRRPGNFHRRRPGNFYRRRPGHFYRRRFHHSPGFHKPGHFNRRRFFHHRAVQSEHFRQAMIFSSSSVDGLCFGGKCAGHVGAGSGVMCGNESRLAGYAMQYDCKIRSIRFFCRHLSY